MVKQFEIYMLDLNRDPEAGGAKNTRPCVVVSPDEMNRYIESVIVAPVSAGNRKYPTRVSFEFLNKKRAVVLDQIRAVEKRRLVKKIGKIKGRTKGKILGVLQEMFAG